MKNPITVNLDNYPSLQQFADADWIAQCDDLESWLIENPIARWLVGSSDAGAHFASQLNDNVQTCIQLTGGQSRVRKLFAPADMSEIWPTLMEIYIATWLSGFASSVEFRSDRAGGPDLLVQFGDGHEHMIEIKLFQQDAFWGELIDRCNALGRKQSLCPQFRVVQDSSNTGGGTNPEIPKSFEQQMTAVARIVNSQIDRFEQHEGGLTGWSRDDGTGVEVRWQQGAGGLFPEREAQGADPEWALRMLSNQLTSGGRAREQIKQADAVFTCVSKHTDLPEFYILRDHLQSSDSAEMSRMIALVPAPILSLESLGTLVAVAISLDQRPAHLAYSLALPRTDTEVRAKQLSLRNALDTQGIATYSSTDR